jgi:hypothetical protein
VDIYGKGLFASSQQLYKIHPKLSYFNSIPNVQKNYQKLFFVVDASLNNSIKRKMN